jgi:hypothetical protein
VANVYKHAIVILILCGLNSCATPYQQSGQSARSSGGWDVQRLGDDKFLITIRGNLFTEKATAIEYFHRKAAEITKTGGYDGYNVIEISDPDETGVVYIDNKPHFLRAPRISGRIQCYKRSHQPVLSPQPPTEQKDIVWSGTAWPIENKMVVTNSHVVKNFKSALLMLPNGNQMYARVEIVDRFNDIAILQPQDPDKLPQPIPLSNSNADLGAEVFTIGYPESDQLGISPKLTSGRITSIAGEKDDPRFYQISTSIYHGSSGGPLLNLKGEAVGITTSGFQRIDLQGVNYAVKISYLKALLDGPILENLQAKPVQDIENLARKFSNSVMIIQVSEAIDAAAPTEEPMDPKPVLVDASLKEINLTNEQLRDFSRLKQLKSLTQYNADDLTVEQKAILANVLNIQPSSITSFRWGKSFAPSGHHRHGLLFFFATYRDVQSQKTKTIWVDTHNNIVETQE